MSTHLPPSIETAKSRSHDDTGMTLPIVLILITVMATIVVTLATYTITNLKSSEVAQNRSDRLSAADAGMRYAIDQLKLRNAGCILDTQEAVLPGVQADFNGASAAITCERITSGFEGIQAFAAVMTGEGMSGSDWLIGTQSGTAAKILGGPVFMERIDSSAFSLSKELEIENGPLLYHDQSGASPCTSTASSVVKADTGNMLIFTPDLIFGPVCVSVGWKELFDSPSVPDLSPLTQRDGTLPLSSPNGSYTDFAGAGGCRVFEPGWYTSPPDVASGESYFKSGEYLFDFNAPFSVKHGTVTAGAINPLTTPALLNELATTNQCLAQQAADTPAPGPGANYGATFYFAQDASVEIESNGAMEIHARLQGTRDYVSIQALCDPTAFPVGTPTEEIWCNPDGGGGFATPKFSTLTDPISDAALMYTNSGNNKEFVSHALFYAPQNRVEFGNATNTAEQKMLGGLIASRVVLQSSASATNFEISVPTSPITAKIALTSTAVKKGETSIEAIVEYRPYEGAIDDRVRVNSWRVCKDAGCPSSSTSICTGGDAAWTANYFNNSTPTGTPDWVDTPATAMFAFNWGSNSPTSPASTIGNNLFSARFTRTVDVSTSGTYRFTVGSDDGQRLKVNGVTVIDQWNIQSVTEFTADVVITDRCNVDIELEYFEDFGQAEVYISWVKL